MSAHTPGQWFVEQELPTERPGIESKADGKFFSIVVWGDSANDNDDAGIHGRTTEEAQANARLIAAAPELLETLERILKFWDSHEASCGPMCEQARAAINKAKGITQ